MIATKIRELDRILGGGLAVAGVTTFLGPTASGKSTLCLQIALDLSTPRKVLLYHEGNGNLEHRMKHLHRDPIWNLDLKGLSLKVGTGLTMETLRGHAQEHQASVLVYDGRGRGGAVIPMNEWVSFAQQSGIAVLMTATTLNNEEIGMLGDIVELEMVPSDPLARNIKTRKTHLESALTGKLRLHPVRKMFYSDDEGVYASSITPNHKVHLP